MKKIGSFFIVSTALILLSYLLIFIGNCGNGLFYSICSFFGTLIQFPTSIIDLLLMDLNIDWIICIIGIMCFIIRIIRNKLEY